MTESDTGTETDPEMGAQPGAETSSETEAGPSRSARRAATRRRIGSRLRAAGRLQTAAAVVPIAVFSLAWTASLTGVSLSDSAVSSLSLPPIPHVAAPRVPAAPIKAPASVSTTPAVGSPTRTIADAQSIEHDANADDIPSVALAAYQRAQSVIDAADPSCHLSWQLLAAIGRVESDHGRFGNSALDAKGIEQPSVYGVRLAIADTDDGLIDAETGYDRAVGPMQFIPSTWQAVAVDADGDGQRNPQDINDAALGAAVYLCSGSGDLATTAGQKAAVFRYNHSTSYVNLVLALMDAYLAGDYQASPDSTQAAGYLSPVVGADVTRKAGRQTTKHDATSPYRSSGHDGSSPSSTTSPTTPTHRSGSAPGSTTKTTGSGTNPGTPKSGKGSGTGGNQAGSTGSGTPSLPDPPKVPKLPKPPKTGVTPVDRLLTVAQATAQCTLDGYVDNPLQSDDAFDVCVTDYTTTGHGPKGESPSAKVLDGVLGG